MVSYTEIQASNRLINDANAPRVAVFVGGTSGIGKLTVHALVATGASMRIYLVGRKSSAERMQAFIEELRTVNDKAEVVWTEGEIALLAESKRVCKIIKSKETRVDLLFLTAGYAPFGPRSETDEGIEVAQSLEYYSRILFIQHLLPLMTKTEAPRVVSVLGGGMERANSINADDFDLKRPGNWSGMNAQIQYTAMNTVTMDKLASDNPQVTFIHSWPGWVNTGNVNRANPSFIMSWVIWLILNPLITIFSFSDEKTGQRHLFQSTSGAFGGRGVPWKGEPGVNTLGTSTGGLFLLNFSCNSTPNANAVSSMRENVQKKLWDHTQEVLRPYM
jgi:NAD(P)-dependent dehydrogenase (short-subunit alcohol dehydrogenase family)